jgi:hypothetical protein
MEGNFMARYVRLFGVLLLNVLIFWASLPAQSKAKTSNDQKIKKLESTVKKLSDRVTILESIISGLPKENGEIAQLRYHYIIASRDGIVNDLVNLSANAYQYRIRPSTMGGGGGSYFGYTIPKAWLKRDEIVDTIKTTVTPDSVIFLGVSNSGLGSVQVTVNSMGQTKDFIFSGEFE